VRRRHSTLPPPHPPPTPPFLDRATPGLRRCPDRPPCVGSKKKKERKQSKKTRGKVTKKRKVTKKKTRGKATPDLQRSLYTRSSCYRNTPVLSEKVCVVTCCLRSSVFILSVLRTPKKKHKTAFCCALSTFATFLASVLSVSLVASSFCTCFSTIIQLCIYCLIVLILALSAAYPELHIFLRRADFVSPGNRSSNLSRVPPVGCRSPLCAWSERIRI
jgi:hypothetical protein